VRVWRLAASVRDTDTSTGTRRRLGKKGKKGSTGQKRSEAFSGVRGGGGVLGEGAGEGAHLALVLDVLVEVVERRLVDRLATLRWPGLGLMGPGLGLGPG